MFTLSKVFACAAAWASLAALAPAQAQSPQPIPPLDPSQASTSVPALRYTSPLAGVRQLGDAAVGDWRQANSLVHARGGWRTYAREAQAPAASAPPAAQAPVPAAPPAHPGHAGHGK